MPPRLFSAVSLLAIAGCNRPAPVNPSPPPTHLDVQPAPEPATPDASAPDASAPDASTPDASAPAAPRVSAWATATPGEHAPVRFDQRDHAAIVRVLCESKPIVRGRCHCPSYAEMGDGIGLQIGAIMTGHFSGPGRDEAVVATSGCESGAGSSMTDASRAIVRRTGAGWQRVFAESGAIGACTPIVSRRGRARLVCQVTGGRFGEYLNKLEVVAFDDDDDDGTVRQETTLLVSYTTYLRLPIFQRPSPLFGFQLTRFALRGTAAYEAGNDSALALDLVIRSDVSCRDSTECAGLDTTTKDLALTYTFDGERFELAPASRGAHAILQARDHYGQ